MNDKKTNRLRIDNRGVAMAYIIVLTGLVGGLSFSLIKFSNQVGNTKREIASVRTQSSLETQMSFLLSTPNNCKASFSTLSFVNQSDRDEPSEGWEVELWTGDSDGVRKEIKYSKDDPHNDLGHLKIKSLKLVLDDPDGIHTPSLPPGAPAGTPLVESINGHIFVSTARDTVQQTEVIKKTSKFPLKVLIQQSGGSYQIKSCQTVSDIECLKTDKSTTLAGCLAGNNLLTEPLGFSSSLDDDNVNNTFIGYRAGMNNGLTSIALETDDARNNTFVGSASGFFNRKGHSNVFMGTYAGKSNIEGNRNIFLGFEAGGNSTTAVGNVFGGFRSGRSNNGINNVAFGHLSGLSSGGSSNVFLGAASGNQTNSRDNTFVGFKAGFSNTGGRDNLFIGHNAGLGNTSGSNNICIGVDSCSTGLNTNDRIIIGHHGATVKNIIIGNPHNTGYSNSTRMLSIGNLVKGDFAARSLDIEGNAKVEGAPPRKNILSHAGWPSTSYTVEAGNKIRYYAPDPPNQFDLEEELDKLEKFLKEDLLRDVLNPWLTWYCNHLASHPGLHQPHGGPIPHVLQAVPVPTVTPFSHCSSLPLTVSIP